MRRVDVRDGDEVVGYRPQQRRLAEADRPVAQTEASWVDLESLVERIGQIHGVVQLDELVFIADNKIVVCEIQLPFGGYLFYGKKNSASLSKSHSAVRRE